jgi:Ribonuclease G/E
MVNKASIGKLWRVDKDLVDSEGLKWVRKQLEDYEWSKVDWITVRRGRSEKYAFRGVCKSPWKGNAYRINCQRKQAHYVPDCLLYARISLVPQLGRDLAEGARRSQGR